MGEVSLSTAPMKQDAQRKTERLHNPAPPLSRPLLHLESSALRNDARICFIIVQSLNDEVFCVGRDLHFYTLQ